MNTHRDSFIFYRSFFESISELDQIQKANLFSAICDYALNGDCAQLSGVEKAVFTLIKPQLDANTKRYKDGNKGGRPKTTEEPLDNQSITTDKPQANHKLTSREPNKNHNLNHNQNENHNQRGYDVLNFLKDDGLIDARSQAPGWDIQGHLVPIYNDGVTSGRLSKPTAPDKAFPAWCKAYTKGKRP